MMSAKDGPGGGATRRSAVPSPSLLDRDDVLVPSSFSVDGKECQSRIVTWWPMCGGFSEVAARLKAEAERQHYHLVGVLHRTEKIRLCKIFCYCFLGFS